MIGVLAERQMILGKDPTPCDADIMPSWELAGTKV
jgi:hypothetical protein